MHLDHCNNNKHACQHNVHILNIQPSTIPIDQTRLLTNHSPSNASRKEEQSNSTTNVKVKKQIQLVFEIF